MGKIEKVLGNRFKEMRVAAGLTQSKLADKAKTSSDTVIRFEHGRALPRSETLDDMLAAVGTDTETFLFGEATNDKKAKRADLLLAIISRLAALNDKQLSGVLAFMEGFPETKSRGAGQVAE